MLSSTLFDESALLGLILAGYDDPTRTVADDVVESLSSFALSAAVAINDAQIHKSFDHWQDGLHLMLDELDDFDQLVT